MEPVVEFERLQSLLEHNESNMMPKSVQMRYKRRLTEVRSLLQEQRHTYPLGAVLESIGTITDKQLNHALEVQEKSLAGKLLGEILVELNLVRREELTHALAIQADVSKIFKPSF